MNVTEIINLAREYVDEPSEDGTNGDYPDSALIQFINAEHRHLYSVVRQTYEDWQGKDYVFLLTDGTLSYTLPRDIISPRRVEIISDGVNSITDTDVTPNYTYLTVDDDAEIIEILPKNFADADSPSFIDYARNRVSQSDGYILWDQSIRFSDGVDLSGTRYARVFYLPGAIDLHQASVASATSTSITLGTVGATTTVGPIRKTDGYYKGAYVQIVSGPGVGEIKRIARHDSVTQTIWIEGAFTTTPTSSSVYSIVSPIVEDFHELLAFGCAMRAKGIKTEDDVSLLGAMYTGLLDDMKAALEKRNEHTVRRIRARRGDS